MPSRRNFLKMTGGAFALLFGLGQAAKFLPRKALLRPPGGQDEAAFIARCLRCDRCRSICPTSVIGLANLSDGILEARTPVMKFHLGYCSFCNQCVEVCPTHALQPFDSKTVKIGLATVQKDICIAWDSGGCMVCMDACPYHAITLDGQSHPVVDSRQCNGCGICEQICPALVMRSYIGGSIRGIVVTPISGKGDGNI
ncbi:4Fe-4S dicluster domain-containing protein [Sporomusa acidovorans]|uniref:Ferredoxin-type protein NapG n=1 Tax=Sporomusa acidovorans (strain ATCC 49682 / DSM 3132 / Mol) TaxID=1123286 RepID=A0ABZ3J2S7_SPOA4|nr:4Fe-4S dicluster domain-containing protein [Sporomusa acidovorans]OZC23176.1 NAD(P)H-quinone oxidoreductase subunit I, chloroplastic [Sporomusa acidovorans DSM 3132]SDE96722.1 ferredoxin-type protein NapG [Sporomusa acidovorans]